MKHLSTIILFSLLQLSNSTIVAAQCTGFAKTASGIHDNSAWGITLDESGHSYVTGFYRGPVTFGNVTLNDTGMYVIKYDSLGNQQWVKTFPGYYPGPFSFINFSQDALYLGTTFLTSANFDGTILTTNNSYPGIAVARLSTDGDVQWAKTFDCTLRSYCYGIRNTASGKVLITGRYQGDLAFGNVTLTNPSSGYCIYLAELDAATGNALWAKSSTVQASNNGGRGYAIRTDPEGNILLSGYYRYILQFGSQMLDNSGNPYGLYAPYVAKFDSTGTCLWIRGGTGNSTFENVYGLTIDTLSNVYFSCPLDEVTSFSGQSFDPVNGNFVLGKYDTNGNLLWINQWGSHITDSISLLTALHINHSGTLTTYGWGLHEIIFDQDTLFSAGNDDIFSADFDLDGNYLSSFITGNIYYEATYDVAFDQDDHAYVAGTFGGDTATLGVFGLHGDAVTDSLVHSNIFVWKNCEGIPNHVSEARETSLQVFPNPSDGRFFISGIEKLNQLPFSICDITGRIITTGKTNDQNIIDIKNVAPGVYVITITGESVRYVARLIHL